MDIGFFCCFYEDAMREADTGIFLDAGRLAGAGCLGILFFQEFYFCRNFIFARASLAISKKWGGHLGHLQ
jgi:hypothetical protein